MIRYNIKHLPEASTQATITPRMFIVHTAVDAPGPTDLAKYFGRADVRAESHYFVHLDGEIDELMPTNVRADANRWANPFAISAETEDEGRPHELGWTDAQLESLEWLIRKDSAEWGFPLQRCDRWDGTGVGYHVMFGAPGPWTSVRGKTCPGPLRIAQFNDILMPRLESEFDVNTQQQVNEIYEWLGGKVMAAHNIPTENLDLGTPILNTNHQTLNVLPALIRSAVTEILADPPATHRANGTFEDAFAEEVAGAVLAALVPGLDAFSDALR